MANMVNGGWYNGQQYWNGQLGAKGVINNPNQQGYGTSVDGSSPAPAASSGGSGVSNSDFDQAFAPQFSALDNLKSGLESDQTNQINAAQSKHDSQSGLIEGQKTSLLNNLQSNQQDWGNQTRSAYEDAVKTYNALGQRNQALYGGQSSAGGAANDLLNQNYLQTKGTIGQSDASAQLAFKGQNQDVVNWVADQHSKLDNWLTDAVTNIKQVFQQGVNEINMQRGQTESAKAQAKLGLLQQLFQNQQQIQNYDNQLRMQVELASKNLPQGSLDTTGFNNQINGYGQAVGGANNSFIGNNQISGSTQQAPIQQYANPVFNANQNTQDILKGLSNGGLTLSR